MLLCFMADRSYEMPACHPHFGIVPDLGRGQHTAEFAESARSDVAHEETYKNATGMAAVGLRFLSDSAYAEMVSAARGLTDSRRDGIGRLIWPDSDRCALNLLMNNGDGIA